MIGTTKPPPGPACTTHFIKCTWFQDFKYKKEWYKFENCVSNSLQYNKEDVLKTIAFVPIKNKYIPNGNPSFQLD